MNFVRDNVVALSILLLSISIITAAYLISKKVRSCDDGHHG